MASATIQRQLKRDIIVILSIKLSIVLAAAFFVFGPNQRQRVDEEALNGRILGGSIAEKAESVAP